MNTKQFPTEMDKKERWNFLLQSFMATAVALILASLLWILASMNLPERNFSALQLFLGSALTWMGMILSFCFPNTMGSQKKDDTINKLLEKTPPVTGEAREALIDDKRSAAVAEAASGGRTGQAASGAGAPFSLPDEPPNIGPIRPSDHDESSADGLGQEAEPASEEVHSPDGGGLQAGPQ